MSLGKQFLTFGKSIMPSFSGPSGTKILKLGPVIEALLKLSNVRKYSPNQTAPHPRGTESSATLPYNRLILADYLHFLCRYARVVLEAGCRALFVCEAVHHPESKCTRPVSSKI